MNRNTLVQWLRPGDILLDRETGELNLLVDLYVDLVRMYAADADDPSPIELIMLRAYAAELWKLRRIDGDKSEQTEIEDDDEQLYMERWANLLRAADERAAVRRCRIHSARDILAGLREMRSGLLPDKMVHAPDGELVLLTGGRGK